MIQQVSDFELELMKTIWGNGGSALYAEIVQALEAKGTPATKNTIISLLSRLIKKGYLSSKKVGRQNTYTALVSETEYHILPRSCRYENRYNPETRQYPPVLHSRYDILFLPLHMTVPENG